MVRDNLENGNKQVRAKLSASQHRQFELRLHAADGAEVHILANCSTLFDPVGRDIGVRDADRHHRAQAERRADSAFGFYDTPTALPNRFFASPSGVDQALLQQKRQEGRSG